MLHIDNIRKKYVTGELVQTALDGVTLTLRDNEFVAILGPSGSGKTTLLNVIGGLDRYDSGDLIINGISTKKYSDRDWDSYRNHTVGFVFQSYNLIPHQTVLANVELALTISGISRSERRNRAVQALTAVGLGNQLHKRPNQMSGGQMQRVAIARALVNNPDILLADEPTGALDSETSLQVMDLLKEVSKDRLVVMVTHNPELAETYANRIVRVKDGRIIDDSNPFVPESTNNEPPKHKNMGRASMSFLTALSLSFNNLKTKKGRTILTAFAGSIGIIGIALILSLSTGFQMYIDQIQEDTLSNYPLMIQTESTDMAALMSAYGSVLTAGKDATDEVVVEQQMLTQMFAQVNANDLASFKRYLEENFDAVDEHLNEVRYHYGIKPLIYSSDTDDGINQVNPGTLFTQVTGMSQMSAFMDSDVFYEMIDNEQMLATQYDVLKGRWPQEKDEMIVVLSSPNQISDYAAYTLGLKDKAELLKFIERDSSQDLDVNNEKPGQWTYDDLMKLDFSLVLPSKLYRYNQPYNVWEDMSDDQEYMRKIISSGLSLKIVGIVAPKENASATLLSEGVAYTCGLTEFIISESADTTIVKSQLQNPDINVFTGKPFGDEKTSSELDFENMIDVDGDKITSAFDMNVDTDTIMAMLESYIEQAYNSLDVDTAPAREEFIHTLSTLATGMLHNYIEGNCGDNGEAQLRLVDAQAIVENYLQSENIAKKLRAMDKKYGLPADTMQQVYSPLLFGMLSVHIAAEAVLPELPEIPEMPTLPENSETIPSDDTEAPTEEITTDSVEDTENPTETETSPTVPEESTDAETLPEETEETMPTEPTVETQPMLPDPTEEQPNPEETQETEPQTPTNNADDETEATIETLSVKGEYNLSLLTEKRETDSVEVDSQTATSDEFLEVVDAMYATISSGDVDRIVSNFMATEVVGKAADVMSAAMMNATVQEKLMEKISGFAPIIMSYIGNSVSVDEDQLASAFQFNMSEDELRRLMTAMTGSEQKNSFEANLRNLGYAQAEKPTAISLYFVNFAAKSEFLNFLDDYNDKMEAEGLEDHIISYTDVTNIMMSSVRTIIDSVSYVLIAFVAVSLVVSSIMIGIITYISVMERTKEIGVLRAIGASKNNISQAFNAETFIIGLCSGLLGIGCTLILNIPINYIIHSLTENTAINAQLPLGGAIILIILSMILTLIGGLIPSRQAAKKDPVIALRSE